jgi:integrase
MRKYVSGDTPRALQKEKDRVRLEYGKGNLSAKQIRFGMFADLWLAAICPKDMNPNTKRMYAGNVARLKEGFGAMRFDQIRQIHLKKYLANRPIVASKQELMTMRRICKSAIKNKYLASDPTEDLTVTYQAPRKRELDTYEREAVRTANLKPSERAFISLILRCGLRRSEAIALTAADITDRVSVSRAAVVSHKAMTINEVTKSRAGHRSIPIPEDVLEAIQGYARGRDGYLFGSFNRTRFWRFWHHIKVMVNDAAGGSSHYDEKKKYRVIDEQRLLEPFSPHIMRHSYCSDLIRAGYRIDEIMYLMGHSSIAMTMNVYNQVKHGGITSKKLEGRGHLKIVKLEGKLSEAVRKKVAVGVQVTG